MTSATWLRSSTGVLPRSSTKDEETYAAPNPVRKLGVPTCASALFTAQKPDACDKRPCVLYPKAAQLPGGSLVASFEDSQTAAVGQTPPVYRSDDSGTTWQKTWPT
ncbi:hypothetical protein [Saccharothrix luteola]|uniref:hypothetical protein n=1 Tax=Saccharothrix luteola TaxID=2893018 RepID=UPI001E3673AE|nr:hypothetical protein [Saccharothrix luteola]MCC8249798.1 hypothetical protein [Saccharothrix luteola]